MAPATRKRLTLPLTIPYKLFSVEVKYSVTCIDHIHHTICNQIADKEIGVFSTINTAAECSVMLKG